MKSILKMQKKGKSGFTLAETLIAILILLMVSAIVAGALPAAANVYKKTVDAANAQVLLSTTMTLLRDELGTATEIKVAEDGKSVTFKSGKSGNTCMIYNNIDKGIMRMADIYTIKTYGEVNGETVEVEQNACREDLPLVSEEAATGMLTSCEFEIDDDMPGVIKVSSIAVNCQGYDSQLAGKEEFYIRTVQRDRAEPEG